MVTDIMIRGQAACRQGIAPATRRMWPTPISGLKWVTTGRSAPWAMSAARFQASMPPTWWASIITISAARGGRRSSRKARIHSYRISHHPWAFGLVGHARRDGSHPQLGDALLEDCGRHAAHPEHPEHPEHAVARLARLVWSRRPTPGPTLVHGARQLAPSWPPCV